MYTYIERAVEGGLNSLERPNLETKSYPKSTVE